MQPPSIHVAAASEQTEKTHAAASRSQLAAASTRQHVSEHVAPKQSMGSCFAVSAAFVVEHPNIVSASAMAAHDRMLDLGARYANGPVARSPCGGPRSAYPAATRRFASESWITRRSRTVRASNRFCSSRAICAL